MNRGALLKTLELVSPALATTNLVPVFGCFVFTNSKVMAYNDVIGIVAPWETKGQPFAANGQILLGLLRNSSSEGVDIVCDPKKSEDLKITLGKSASKLPFFGEDEFIFLEPDIDALDKTKLTPALLLATQTCLTTSSTDNSMPALMGVCFNFEEGALFSCDGDALTKHRADIRGKGVYTAPNQFCSALSRICEETETYDGELVFTRQWVRASLANGYVLYGRMIENDTPLDHEKLITRSLQGGPEFVGLPKGLNEALARARVFADAESTPTTFSIKDGTLKMATDTKHSGQVKDVLNIKGHKDVEALIHPNLMVRSIKVCDEICILHNCTAYRNGEAILQVVGNVGS